MNIRGATLQTNREKAKKKKSTISRLGSTGYVPYLLLSAKA